MSLSKNEAVLWSDIEALYTTLNAIQTEHQLATTAKPSKKNQAVLANDAKALVNAIEALGTSATQITTSQANVAGTIPSVGDLLEPTIFRNCDTTLQTLSRVAFRSSNFNFTSFSNNNGFGSKTFNFSFGSFSSNVNFGSRTSNNGFTSLSGNHSFSSHGHNVSFTYGGNTGGFGSNTSDRGCGVYCPSRQ